MSRRLNLPRPTVNAFRRSLLVWYHRHKRDLPWRGIRDPYRTWISEIMLQQTRVETVREYYRRWLDAFPTLESLARAPFAKVHRLWEGLGYYSRARNLHLAAKLMQGRVPGTVAELMALPGIGRYTAGAIASIAFDQRAPIVDGNIVRVMARVFARDDGYWELAEALLPSRNCGDFNQALMELGALVCTPVNPRCDTCPLYRVCQTRSDARPKRKPRPVRRVTQDVLFVERAGRILLRQRPSTGELAGMWELPPGRSSQRLLTLRHAITDRQITLRIFAGQEGEGRWFTRQQVARLTLPAAHRRALTVITGSAHPSRAAAGQKYR